MQHVKNRRRHCCYNLRPSLLPQPYFPATSDQTRDGRLIDDTLIPPLLGICDSVFHGLKAVLIRTHGAVQGAYDQKKLDYTKKLRKRGVVIFPQLQGPENHCDVGANQAQISSFQGVKKSKVGWDINVLLQALTTANSGTVIVMFARYWWCNIIGGRKSNSNQLYFLHDGRFCNKSVCNHDSC